MAAKDNGKNVFEELEKSNVQELKCKEKIRQLNAKIEIIKSRHSVKLRKERTRRLIQIGALTEKYFAVSEVDKVENILQELIGLDEVKNVLEKVKK